MADVRARFPVTLPVWPVDEEGHCTCYLGCACKRPGKHADEKAPETGPYAVLAGPGGVLVIDVDVKSGVDGFAQLVPWELEDTFTVATPSGGVHLYYLHPGDELANKKLDSAIDVRANARSDGGHSYVVGPGSAGYVKTSDPCTVLPGPEYRILDDVLLASPSELVLAWLRMGGEKKTGFEPTAIDATSPLYEERVAKGIHACLSMPPSKADGEAGKNLFALALKLVRTLELPVDVAQELVEEHFNPRCTNTLGDSYPWDPEDILHKLEDARDKSELPCGLNEGLSDKLKEKAKPKGLRKLLQKPKDRRTHNEKHEYDLKIGELAAHPDPKKVSFNELVAHYTKHPKWSGCWQYDLFEEQLVCVDPPIRLDAEVKGLSEDDVSAIRSCLEFDGMLATEKDILAAVKSAARANEFHPVKDYLAALPSGDPEIFNGLAKRLYGTTEPHADAFLQKTLVAAVRRILSPGCQVDTVLIIHGPKQGEGKTQSVEALFGRWTRRGLPADLGNRDAAHALHGFWGIELGEMTVLLRNESATIKDFMSKQVDNYRAFGNGQKHRNKRQCVFIGTTNDDDFLRDATGNRRYWPISIPGDHDVPLDWLREHRDEIWAGALALAVDETFRHWFTREEEGSLHTVREEFVETDAWQDKVEAYCMGRKFVRSSDVFESLGGELKDFDRRKTLRVTDTLKRLGCKKVVQGRAKQWLVPEELEMRIKEKTNKPLASSLAS